MRLTATTFVLFSSLCCIVSAQEPLLHEKPTTDAQGVSLKNDRGGHVDIAVVPKFRVIATFAYGRNARWQGIQEMDDRRNNDHIAG